MLCGPCGQEVARIISPGHLPNNLTVEKIRAGNSNIRNPILVSYVAKGLLPYHGLGSGIKRALEKWPTIDFTNDHDGCLFTATVHRKAVEELELVKITPKGSLINDTTSKKTPWEDRVKAQVGTTPKRNRRQGDPVTDPVTDPVDDPVTDPVIRLLRELEHGEKSLKELRTALNLSHRPTFRSNYLHPALKKGLIELTIPDKPNSRLQKYRLTDRGRQLVAQHGGG